MNVLTDKQRHDIIANSVDMGQVLDAAFALGRECSRAEVERLTKSRNAAIRQRDLAQQQRDLACQLPERVARAIEADYLGADYGRNYDGTESTHAALAHAHDEALEHAARIARDIGGAE